MKRTIIRNAWVIASPPREPSRVPTDILIEGSEIAAIGEHLNVADADVHDATGRIIIPGLVNAHLHSWQTGLRGIACDWGLFDYLARMHGVLAMQFTPADLRVAALAGALNQIASGTTTIADWCHNNPSSEHTDAVVQGLAESGVRALFLHGTPRPLHGTAAAGAHPRLEIERLAGSSFATRTGLLSLGIAIPGPLYSDIDVVQHDLSLAREFGIVASMHYSGGTASDGVWETLEQQDLLGPRVNLVHANTIDDGLLARLIDLGVSFTVTPEVEMGDGHGHPITGRLRALGTAPSLGVDIESAISGEMLTVARIALAHQRALDHATARTQGMLAPPIPAREALAWATIEGARALGMADRIGSLEVGKQADLAMINARALNLWPNNDLFATVLQASLANVEAVMIGGVWRKLDGRLLYGDLDRLFGELADSSRRILHASGLAS